MAFRTSHFDAMGVYMNNIYSIGIKKVAIERTSQDILMNFGFRVKALLYAGSVSAVETLNTVVHLSICLFSRGFNFNK